MLIVVCVRRLHGCVAVVLGCCLGSSFCELASFFMNELLDIYLKCCVICIVFYLKKRTQLEEF